MAGIIPQNREQVRMQVSSPVPIASADSARDVGQAMQRFGNTLMDVGTTIKQEHKQIETLDRNTRVAQAQTELRTIKGTAANQSLAESGPDGSDMGKLYEEKTKPAVEAIMKRFKDDPEGFAAVQQDNMLVDIKIGGKLQEEATAKKEKHIYDRIDGTSMTAADRVRENPNQVLVESELKIFNRDMDKAAAANPSFKNNAEGLKKMHAERLARSYIQGLGNKGAYGEILNQLSANQTDREMFTDVDPVKAKELGMIDSAEADRLSASGEYHKMPTLTKKDKKALSPEMSALLSKLDPKTKESFLDAARVKAKERVEMNMADLNAELTGFVSLAAQGVPIDDKQVGKLKAQVNANGNMTVAAKVRVMDKIDTAQALGETLSLAAGMHPSQHGELEKKFDEKIKLVNDASAKIDPRMGQAGSSLAVQASRMQMKQQLLQGLAEQKKLVEKDAATFYLVNDPELELMRRGTLDQSAEGIKATQKYASAMIEKQTRLGVAPASRRILTQGETMQIAQTLKAAPSSSESNQVLNQLQAKYGPRHFPQIMSDLAKDDKELARYQVAIYAPEGTRLNLLDAIKNEKAIETSFKAREDHAAQQGLVKSSIKSVMSDFTQAAMGSAPDSGSRGLLNSFEDAIELQVKQGLEKGRNKGVDKLAEEAYKEIIGSQYQVVSGPKGGVIVPNTVNNRPITPGRVEGFLAAYSEPGAFSELGVAVPPEYKDDQMKYKNEILPRTHRWVTNQSQNGLTLMHLYQGQMVPVKNVYGKEVEVSYESLLMRPSARTLGAEKGFLGGIGLTGTRTR